MVRIKKLAKCEKGSRQWEKYRRAFNYILGKSNAQLTDILHKTTREFVNWCLENQVREVVVGDVAGVLAAEGISLQKVDEAYTTQTCPVCGRRKRTSSRNYSCLCGYQDFGNYL
ncbi:transposase [Peptococcaceae bacterium DYL19]|nr:zinc ribbon domain-containing protein [Phosphitispora fastidiosa]MBU7007848.1 transposase [Phosphitispora fastidiosa]